MLKKLIYGLAALLTAPFVFSYEDAEIDLLYTPKDISGIAARDIKYLCGANSIFITRRLIGENPDYVEIYDSLLSSDGKHISLADLAAYLSKHRIENTLVRLSPYEMSSYDGAIFIVYKPPPKNSDIGHFFVIKANGREALIFDPPKRTVRIANEKLEKSDRFNAVIIAKDPPFPARFYIISGIGLAFICAGTAFYLFMRKK